MSLICSKTFNVSLICSKNIQHEFDLQQKHSTWVWSAAKTFGVSLACSKNIQHEFDLQQKHTARVLICSRNIQRKFDLQQNHSTWGRSAAKTFNVSFICQNSSATESLIPQPITRSKNFQREFDLQHKQSVMRCRRSRSSTAINQKYRKNPYDKSITEKSSYREGTFPRDVYGTCFVEDLSNKNLASCVCALVHCYCVRYRTGTLFATGL